VSTEVAQFPPLFDEEHDAFRESARTFLRREVVPHYDAWRRAGGIPRDLLRTAAEHGFLGMRVPEEHGGAGVDDLRFGVVFAQEAMAAGAHDLALIAALHNDVALPALLRASREDLLPGLAAVVSGDLTIEGSAVNGSASFVVAGLEADAFVVATRDGTIALVERDARGVSVAPGDSPIGLLASGLTEVTFASVAAVVLDRASHELAIDRDLALAVTALAGARSALATTVAYVGERKAFGQPIASFENTRHALARVLAELWSAEALLEGALRDRLAGSLEIAHSAAVNVRSCAVYDHAVDTGVQLHGGYGYILEYPIAHAFADARFWSLQATARVDDIVSALFP
jgi:acyl-CoA dehydrogenase